MSRRQRLALGMLLCPLALATFACDEEKPVERAAPAVDVNVQALLTCAPTSTATYNVLTSTASSVTCALPSSLQANDVLVAFVAIGSNSQSATGTGWTAVTNGAQTDTASSNSTSVATGLFYHTYTGGGDTVTGTFSISGTTRRMSCTIVAMRGCAVPSSAVTPANKVNNTASTTLTGTTSSSGNATGSALLNFFSANDDNGSTSTAIGAAGSGWTDVVNTGATTTSTALLVAASYKNVTTSSAISGDARSINPNVTRGVMITTVLASGSAGSGGNGAICTAGGDCVSGNCVDGRCCNTTCGGGVATDCQACSVAAGATTNGTCGNIGNGTVCRATTGSCDVAETCTGTSTTCPTDAVLASSNTCRGTAGACDLAENCTGTSASCPTDAFRSSATSCRGTAGECDLAESCTGTAAACPADAKKVNATACTADSSPCTLDQCNGTADACQHPAGNSGVVCNATTGVCDVAETCTGTSTTCPANAYGASSVVCRATAGVCDAAEYCTGTSDSCPAADAKQASGAACTSDGIPCTVDQCDGTTDVCQHPVGNAGMSCRGAAGACDAVEVCTGTSTTCPADVLSVAGVVCRATAGTCDLEETCTGTSNACPSDVVLPNTLTCRALNGACDVAAESCTGTTGSCPADTFRASTYTCNASTGVCDPAELCTGSSNACPSNVFSSSATVCRGTTGACDAAETCTGSTGACPADALASSSTPCRSQSNICDATELCTGTSTTCPTDVYAPTGTDCGYTTGAVTIYSTGTPTHSELRNTGYSAASVTNAGPSSAWTNALRYSTTLPTSGADQYLYQQISTTARTFQAGDMVEYDVFLADSQSHIGGLDIENGGTALRGSGISDQNSLSCNPSTNITSNAAGAWYHRRYVLGGTGMVNTTSTSWTIADENDTAHSAYTAYYDNVIVATTAGACAANVCKVKTGYGCTANSDCATNVCNSLTLDASNTHRWNLDTNANASVGGQNGSTNGSVSWSGGGAVLTGGTSGPYLSVPTAVMSGLTDVTFEAWFSIDTHVTGQRIFDFGDDTTEYIYLTDRFDGTNIPRVGYRRNSGTEIRFSATTGFATSTLTHVAVSVDGATSMTLYINGTYAGSVALGGSDALTSMTFDRNYIGGCQSSSDPRLDGNVYDFRVYNKALSAAEVLATYRKGVDSKVCSAGYSNGTACTTAFECSSGYCVDNRCCSTACDGGDTANCQACSIAAGATADGTCALLPSSFECRASVDPSCDFAESCTGTSAVCPDNDQ